MIIDLHQRWRNDQMPCLKKNPEMFFFNNGAETLAHPSPKVQIKWDRAKAICHTCPVMKQCARDNLGEVEGVWGGLDPAQRIRLRSVHAYNVRELTGPLKEEYAKLAYDLRKEQHLPWSEIGRLMGFDFATAQYLYDWWKAHLEAQPEEIPAVVDLPPPEAEATEIHPNAEFPARPPSQGDGWVRYGRRIVWGYYLGQTEDDAWFYMKIKLLAQEYSVCWIKAEDLKLIRNVARNVMIRSGKSGSRIYGTYLSPRDRVG